MRDRRNDGSVGLVLDMPKSVPIEVTCMCGEKFQGLIAGDEYIIHYVSKHGPYDSGGFDEVLPQKPLPA